MQGRTPCPCCLSSPQYTPFFPRLLLRLPPSVLVGSPQAGQPVSPNCEEFFNLVTSGLVCANALGWPFYLSARFVLTLNCFTEKHLLPRQCPDLRPYHPLLQGNFFGCLVVPFGAWVPMGTWVGRLLSFRMFCCRGSSMCVSEVKTRRWWPTAHWQNARLSVP